MRYLGDRTQDKTWNSLMFYIQLICIDWWKFYTVILACLHFDWNLPGEVRYGIFHSWDNVGAESFGFWSTVDVWTRDAQPAQEAIMTWELGNHSRPTSTTRQPWASTASQPPLSPQRGHPLPQSRGPASPRKVPMAPQAEVELSGKGEAPPQAPHTSLHLHLFETFPL